MASLVIERVNDSVVVEQDGKTVMMMSMDTARDLGLSLLKITSYGIDSLDDLPTGWQ